MTHTIDTDLKLPAEGLFFTSDTHFGHANIIKYCKRPFNSAAHMDEVMIARWNETVGPDDTVFHLGDFCFGPPRRWLELLDRLSGRIYLILGNHDYKSLTESTVARFAQVSMQMRLTVEGQKIYLNHYPYLCFDGGYHNVWQLFGHVHSSRQSKGYESERLQHLYTTQYDVGADNNDYRPVSFKQVAAIITARQATAASPAAAAAADAGATAHS